MPATDDFVATQTAINSPYRRGVAVVPSDSVDLGNVSRAIYIGGTGTLTYISQGGDTVALLGSIPVGAVLPICASRVKATGTTATNIVAFW